MKDIFTATVTVTSKQLAELIIWAVKNNCSGGLTFGADFGDTTEAPAPPDEMSAWERSQHMAHRQLRRAELDERYILNDRGRVDIDASCAAMGLSREQLTSNRWKAGSTEHRVKCAILKEQELKLKRRRRRKRKPSDALVRNSSGAIAIEESLEAVGLTREDVLSKSWKRGSAPHRIKAAICCGWRAMLKSNRERKSARAYRDRYSSNGNFLGESQMKEKGLRDTSKA
tara:strand:+ start:22343 stop:23026 length:684 start_codon:yes stop_codon:yes gene_type:complete